MATASSHIYERRLYTSQYHHLPMRLIDLPLDILTLIPEHFESLDDLHAIILTSRALYFANSSPTPSLIRHLATSPHSGIQPYPHLFIAIKARVLADWAVQSAANRKSLHAAIITGGPQGVLDLALSISPLTLEDLTFLRTARLTVLDPAIEILEPMCGNIDDILDPDYETACSNVPLSMVNYWIYCDLFYHTIAAPVLCRAARVRAPVPLSNNTRLKWVYQFLPDCPKRSDVDEEYELLNMRHFLQEGLLEILPKQVVTMPPAYRGVFQRCVNHMGLASLKLVVLYEEDISGAAGAPDEIWALATAIEGLSDAALLEAYTRTGVNDDENEDDKVLDWVSLQADISSFWRVH
ncbi:hypothetical protein A0H81_00408 [Grifola frondosa]|uniref:Uncharacterized protein n=1 Tax=Grifola frondosa TaxID=5627 RepID=A0A1C7MNV6_GRIFR|nr:hypothetical protein A0H81_00408 [Grifola frondosa]